MIDFLLNHPFKDTLLLIISILSGVLGRLGGWEKGNRLFRIIGVPGCIILIIATILPIVWSLKLIGALALSFGAIMGVSSTYFKRKGTEAVWWNFLLIGLTEGLAILPFVLVYHHWLGYTIRTIVCTILVCVWDILIGWDVLEEFGRYFIIAITMVFLLI